LFDHKKNTRYYTEAFQVQERQVLVYLKQAGEKKFAP